MDGSILTDKINKKTCQKYYFLKRLMQKLYEI